MTESRGRVPLRGFNFSSNMFRFCVNFFMKAPDMIYYASYEENVRLSGPVSRHG